MRDTAAAPPRLGRAGPRGRTVKENGGGDGLQGSGGGAGPVPQAARGRPSQAARLYKGPSPLPIAPHREEGPRRPPGRGEKPGATLPSRPLTAPAPPPASSLPALPAPAATTGPAARPAPRPGPARPPQSPGRGCAQAGPGPAPAGRESQDGGGGRRGRGRLTATPLRRVRGAGLRAACLTPAARGGAGGLPPPPLLLLRRHRRGSGRPARLRERLHRGRAAPSAAPCGRS